MTARILSPWALDEEGGNYPLLMDALRLAGFGASTGHPWTMVDVTGQPAQNLSPDPNLYILEVNCDSETLAAIKADNRFLVVWDDAIVSLRRGAKRDDKPSAASFGQFRSAIAQLGIKQADINAAVGNKVNGRTWHLICNDLIVWLKARPKAV